MLIISSKVKYGVAALMELADNYGKGLLQSKVIAERRSIPPNYLEQLLNQLTRAGLVRAARGSRGGYELAASPEDITFLQIWEVMDGGPDAAKSEALGDDAVHALYSEAEQKVKKVFGISLAELFARQRTYDETTGQTLMFHI